MSRLLKKIGKFFWYSRSRFSFIDFPIPCRLPYGSWFLAKGDETGLVLFLRIPREENEWRFINQLLKPGMVFFDIGANQGFYTLLAAKKVGEKGEVFAFEPIPREFKNLKKNIFINNFKNVKTEQFALGNKKSTEKMFVCLGGKGSYSSLRPPSEKIKVRKKIIEVPLVILDEYVRSNNISSIDFMKIDVEGGEFNVLKGASNVLSKKRPILMCEASEERTRQWGYSAFEICYFLEKHNYKCFELISKDIFKPIIKKKELNENLIAIPKEKMNNFKISK